MDEQFIVIKPFIYRDVKMKPGAVWEPQGCKNDDAIISTGRFVRRVRVSQEAKRPAAKRNPKKAEATA